MKTPLTATTPTAQRDASVGYILQHSRRIARGASAQRERAASALENSTRAKSLEFSLLRALFKRVLSRRTHRQTGAPARAEARERTRQRFVRGTDRPSRRIARGASAQRERAVSALENSTRAKSLEFSLLCALFKRVLSRRDTPTNRRTGMRRGARTHAPVSRAECLEATPLFFRPVSVVRGTYTPTHVLVAFYK